MILSKAPLRISFFGGSTDYSQWFQEHDGAVLGTSIDKAMYVCLHDGRSTSFSDLPTKSGLGSSSAYTVALLRACTSLDQLTISRLATTWEFDKTGGKVGYQDQYLCALGGFHLLRFNEHGIRDRLIDKKEVEHLQDYLMMFDTHQYRRGGDVVAHQLAEMDKHEKLLERMVSMVTDGLNAIKNQDWQGFGALLNDSWMMKKELSPYVSTPAIDAIYDRAKAAGAIGGKLLGAGGGGFFLIFAEPDKKKDVRAALDDLTCVPVQFENEGSVVLYHD